MGIYAEYDQHISPWQQNIRKISLLFPGQGNCLSLMAGSCSEPVKSFRKSFHKRANFIKGPGKAICPPEFLIQILMDPVYAKKLDHLLDKMTLIQEVDNHIQLMYLKHKSVWLSTATDFCILNIIDKSMFVHVSSSVIDPQVLEEKGYVIGKVPLGG